MEGIVFSDADRHGAVCLYVRRAVGVDTDKGICLVVICDLGALDAADRLYCIVVGEQDLVSAVFKFRAELPAHHHGQIIFVKRARLTVCSDAVGVFHLGGPGTEGLLGGRHLGGMSGIDDDQEIFALRGKIDVFSSGQIVRYRRLSAGVPG